jgi:tetratricopeptide (TPR) repeat protein
MGRNAAKKLSSKAGANKPGASNATIEPGPEVAIQQGIAAAAKGDADAAYRIFSQTVELHPAVPEAWVWLGGTSPDLDKAETAFEKAYSLDPENEYASLGLRWVRLQRKAALNDIMGAPMPAPESPTWSEQVSYSPPVEAPGVQADTITCPNCGKANSRSEKFCQDCGQDLQTALAAANPQGFIQPVEVQRDLSKYFIAVGVALLLLTLGVTIYLLLRPQG